jgi:hypothetical protein
VNALLESLVARGEIDSYTWVSIDDAVVPYDIVRVSNVDVGRDTGSVEIAEDFTALAQRLLQAADRFDAGVRVDGFSLDSSPCRWKRVGHVRIPRTSRNDVPPQLPRLPRPLGTNKKAGGRNPLLSRCSSSDEVVPGGGIEPPTRGFSVRPVHPLGLGGTRSSATKPLIPRNAA